MMNPESPFTKIFFTFFNDPEPEELLRTEQQELNELINKKLYAKLGEKAAYYTRSENKIGRLKEDISYDLIQSQLRAVKLELEKFFTQQNIGSIATLNDFFDRVFNPSSDHITLFYKEQGKRILEEVSILLLDNSIDLGQRIKIINEFFASDGLAQCIDNCYLLILDINKKLKSLKRANHHIYYLIRNYATELASDVANSRPFGSPKKYVDIVCDIAKVATISYEIHARNFFLLYAKENGFPIDVLPDVIAENLRSRFLDFDLQHTYLEDFKKRFTIDSILDYLSQNYYYEIAETIKDSQLNYISKQKLIQNKLELLGLDDHFYWHEAFDFKGDTFSIKSITSLKITIISRLTQNPWLRYWVDPYFLELDNKKYTFYHYKEHVDVSWISFEEEVSKKIKRASFLELFGFDEIEGLSQKQKESLRIEFIDKMNIIDNAKELDFLLKNYPIVEFYITTEQIVKIICKNEDVILFARLIKNLSKEKGEIVIEQLTEPFIKRMLAHAFLYANVETRIKEIPKSYFHNFSPEATMDVLSLTGDLLRELIYKEFRQFEDFYFPQFKFVDYLDNIDFSYCNLKKALFTQSISNINFNSAYLDGVKFLMKLSDVSFSNVNLKKTEFLGAEHFHFEGITLYKATLSTQSFNQLLKANVVDFSYSNLKEVNFKPILTLPIQLDFSHADLEGNDLSKLNLNKIKFFNANLKKANLLGSSFKKKNINKDLLIQGAQLDWKTVILLYSAKIRNFDKTRIIASISLENTLMRKVKLKEASFKNTEFSGSYSLINFIKCDFSDAKFTSSVEKTYSILVDILYKKCNLNKTKFIENKFISTQFIRCEVSSLTLINVQLSVNILFSLYQHGHRDFREVKSLSGHLPEKIIPFPFAGASLSEAIFLALYKQGLRDFRSANLYHFNLRGTLNREGISEPDLQLESTIYKQSLLVCAQKRSERSLPSSPLSSKKCIVHFLIKKINSTKEMIKIEDLNHLSRDLKDKKIADNFYQYIKEISLDFTPLEQIRKVYKINFYWSYFPKKEEELIKIVYFLKKSIVVEDRLNIRICFYLPKKLIFNADTELFYKDLTKLGFTKLFFSYIEINMITHIVTSRKKTIRFNEGFNNLKQIHQDKLKLNKISKSVPLNKFSRERLSSFHKNIQKFIQASHLGIKKGYQYQIGLALMNLISAAILNSHTETKTLTLQQKQTLVDYAELVAKQQSQVRGSTEREYFLALNIVKKCIERGECYNQETVLFDIQDTLARSRPHAVMSAQIFWRGMKRFFSGISYYFNYRFTRLKKIFQDTEENRTYIEQEQSDSSALWKPNILPSRSLTTSQPFENVTTYDEDYFINLDHEGHQSVDFPEDFLEKMQSGLFFYLQLMPAHLNKKRMYNWYDYPLLVDFIRNIERTFAGLGFQFKPDDDFNEADVAGLLYELWLALDKKGITDQADPQFILELFQDEDFIESLFYKNNKTYPLYNNQSLVSPPLTEKRKRSLFVDINPNLVANASHHSQTFFDQNQKQGLATSVFSTAPYLAFSNERIDANLNLDLITTYKNNLAKKSHYFFNYSAEAENETKFVKKTSISFNLDRINSNIFLLDYLINLFKSFFQDQNIKGRGKNNSYSFLNGDVKKIKNTVSANEHVFPSKLEEAEQNVVLLQRVR